MSSDKLEYPVIYLDSSDFDDNGELVNDTLISTHKPVIVLIQSNHCGWCTQAKPAYISSANNNRNIIFSVIDYETDSDAAKKVSKVSECKGFPHYMCYKNGKFVSDDIKGRDEKNLKEFASKN